MLTVHTREEEREADFLGVRSMPGASMDPQGMITMFQKLLKIEERDSDLLGSLFSDHPDAQERIDNTRYEIGRMRRRRRSLWHRLQSVMPVFFQTKSCLLNAYRFHPCSEVGSP